jgi:stage II sporulation protein GA (sporulation sigma-E factor processing peptidase)
VYLDLTLALNVAVNYFLLGLTGIIARKKTSFSRLLAGSLFGAVFIFILFLPGSSVLYTWLGKTLLPLAMIVLSFQPRQWTQGLLLFTVFYLCSFAMGGVVFALISWCSCKADFYYGISSLPAPSVLSVFFAGFLLYTATRWLGPVLVEKLNFKLPITALQVEICFLGKAKEFSAFLDTGNMLKEPFSGFPVAIVSYAAIKEMLPLEINVFLSNKEKVNWSNLGDILAGTAAPFKFSLIPCRTLTGEDFLLGFQPEHIKIRQNGREIEIKKKVVLGIQPEHLSSNVEYEVLLPLALWRMAQDEEGL